MSNKQEGTLIRCVICGTPYTLRKITRGDEKVYICESHYAVATSHLKKKGGYDE